MPISLPNLDDRRYEDLVDEALALIPVHAPEWTNHNASDPGITLIELFAYLTEMLIYRLNRITVENRVAFLNLIDAGKSQDANTGGVIENRQVTKRTPEDYRDPNKLKEEMRRVIANLRKPARAVTAEDYEALVLEKFSDEISRARAVPGRDLSPSSRTKDPSAHMSIVIVPGPSNVLVSRVTGITDYWTGMSVAVITPSPLVGLPSEYLYVGLGSQFTAIQFDISGKGEGYNLAFEYSRVTAANPDWARLTTEKHELADGTSAWATSGKVEFAIPDDWSKSKVATREAYWIRISTDKPPKKVATAFSVAAVSDMKHLEDYLEPLRLLTTIVRVVEPGYVRIGVQLTLHLEPDAVETTVREAALTELSSFFNPRTGWRDGKGWPFGRDVYLSEIIERLVHVPGVDYVTRTKDEKDKYVPALKVISPNTKTVIDDSVSLEPYELVYFSVSDTTFTVPPPPQRDLRA